MLQWERNKKQQMKESDLIKHLISKKYTTEQIMQFVLRFREKTLKPRENFADYLFLLCKKLTYFKQINVEQKWIKVISKSFDNLFNVNSGEFYLYNLPPRLGKTTIITVCGSAFILGKCFSFYETPIKILIVCSSESTLENVMNAKIKSIVKSSFFQELFPTLKVIKANTRTIQFSNNSSINFIVSGSNAIGDGFHFVFFDDFMNPNDLNSEAKMSTAETHLVAFLGRKEYVPRTKSIIVEQRISTDDTTAKFVNLLNKGSIKYNHIVLPYEITSDISIFNIDFYQGEFIDKKFDEADKHQLRTLRGEVIWQTQYQQNPTQSTGIFFKPYHFENLTPLQDIINQEGFYYISVDPASSDGKNADFTGIALMKYHPVKKKIYLQEIFSIKPISDNATLSSNQVINLISSLYKKYSTQSLGCQVLIEINGVGAYMPNILVEKGIPLSRIKTIKRSSSMRSQGSTNAKNLKESMALDIATRIEHGTLVLPKLEESSGMYNFKKQLLDFPNGKNDDMVDAVSNILYFLNESNKFGRVDDYSKVELNSPFN